MAYTLYTGQIIEALRESNHPRASEFVDAFNKLTDDAGSVLAESLGIDRLPVSELWDGEAAVGFLPSQPGQKLPQALAGYDSEMEWSD